ncbi:LOB domain-containing protein 36, partial [Capsicum baccatum]
FFRNRRMSSSSSPCAACKFLRRKCTQECVFAPYFPPDQPQKFANVHKVFGASNVAKLLNELNAAQREDAVNSLAYEAEYRLRDPVYGCVGLISLLQHKLKQVQDDLLAAKKELTNYIGPSAMLPVNLQPPGFIPQHHMNVPSSSTMMPFNMNPILGMPTGVPQGGQLMIPDPQQQQQQTIEAQQFAAALAAREQREQQEMLGNYEQQQQQQQHPSQQHDILRFHSGLDSTSSVTATGFHQMSSPISPSLVLVGTPENPHNLFPPTGQHGHSYPSYQERQLQSQLLLQQQQPPPQQPETPRQQQRAKSQEEARSTGPSC